MRSHRRLRDFRTVGLLLIFGLALSTASVGNEELSLSERYWLYLNEGRDTVIFDPIGRDAVRPENRVGESEEFNERRRKILDEIAVSPLRPDIVGSGESAAAQPQSDWPTLGRDNSHTGATDDPGPTIGIEHWRFPVGYDYSATALVHGSTVFVASPGSESVLFALNRSTGALKFRVNRSPVRQGLSLKAGGQVILHGRDLASVPGIGFNGTVGEIHTFDPRSGRLLGSVSAGPVETRFSMPEDDGDPFIAFASDSRRSVTVKKVKSGRMWWRFPAGEGVGEPVIAGNLVFAATDDGSMWALNLHGAERVAWCHRIDAQWRTSPAVEDGMVVAGANNGVVYAFDAESGAVAWKTRVGPPEGRAHQNFSTALISAGRVLIGSADGNLYCLDARTGEIRWKSAAGDWIRAKPFAFGSTVIVGTYSGELVAFWDRGGDPTELWRTRVGVHPITGDLSGDKEGVFAANNHARLFCVELSTGQVSWSRRLIPSAEIDGRDLLADAPPQIHQAPPTVAGGIVYTAGPDRLLSAVDAASGKLVWRHEINGRAAAAPTHHNGVVFIGEYLGGSRFRALDAKTGHEVWSKEIGGVWASPTCVDGEVYVGTTEGKILCLSVDTGAELWSWTTGGGVYPAPAVDEESVYFGSWDGYYYALDRRSGAMRWAWSPPGYPYHIGGRPDSAAPVIFDGKIIAPILGGKYVAIDSLSGRTVWEWVPPKGICNVTAAVHDGVVYVGSFGNTYIQPFGASLFALDGRSGRQLWEIKSLGGLTTPAFTGEGLMICGSLNTPYIEGYRVRTDGLTPEIVWRLKTEGHMVESLPAISGGMGFFLSSDGWLRAIR